jgi:predicted unusual protein kinase regulating ubiquinone biosynthesis (AarF/ABC1/UbiB family)
MVVLELTLQKPFRWQRIRYSPLVRQMDIVLSSAQFMVYLWWDKTFPRQSDRYRNRRAQWLVGTLLDLGPTFIKLGQALSTRADLLPPEYIEALTKLQDQVPQFSAEAAIATVEAELGAPIYSLYRQFDLMPIAAASLGQVHKARLHTGEEVVVKVQRPELDRLFHLDLKVLRRLVRFCDRSFPWIRQYQIDAIYQEFAEILYKEIDYIQEAINADRFRFNFRHHPRILVPKIYPRHTTRKVLTMDYLPGIKISDRQSLEACGINLKEINQLGICSYLKQLLQDGFFQADPHPGNMAVSPDGCLIFYDFGMMAEVHPINKDQMVKTFFAVLRKDTDQVIDTLMDLGLIEPVADMTPIRRVTSFLLEQFTEKPIELQAFTQMRTELYALYEQQPFRLPPKMTFILKALTTLDGVARTLDPDYNLIMAAKPFVKSLAVSNQGTMGIGELVRQAQKFVVFKLRQPSSGDLLLRQAEEEREHAEFQRRMQALARDRATKSLHLSIRCLIYACMTGFALLSATGLWVNGYTNWAIAAFAIAGIGGMILLRSLFHRIVQNQFNPLLEK